MGHVLACCLWLLLIASSLQADNNLYHGYTEPIKVLHHLKQLEYDLENLDPSVVRDLEASVHQMSELDKLMKAIIVAMSKPNRTISETCSDQTINFFTGLLNKNDTWAKMSELPRCNHIHTVHVTVPQVSAPTTACH